jgi:hypothetical protein
MDIINTRSIMNAIETAWQQEVADIDAAMELAITEDLYKWDKRTMRSTGEVAGSPRNIVDTGALRDSQSVVPIGSLEVEFEWGVDYAEDVHTGIRTEGGVTPPRPWTQYAIAGDSSAPIAYQRDSAILNVVDDFAEKIRNQLTVNSE